MSQLQTNSIVPVGGIPAGASGGGIIQIVSATTTARITSTTTTFTDISGLSVSITPRSTSNKILILASVSGHNDGFGHFVRLMRGATAISVGDASSNRVQSTMANYYNSDVNSPTTNGAVFLDSPATTSSTTYKLQHRKGTGSGTIYINGTANDADADYTGRTISTITVLEISG